MNMFLPKDKVYIPELEKWGVVIGVYLSTSGTEYKVRYFHDQQPYETYFYDFELAANQNATTA